MGGVHEGPEIIRGAVQPRGGKQVNAVIAPTEAAREFVDRHDLQHGDA
jgi:hypothetical protein